MMNLKKAFFLLIHFALESLKIVFAGPTDSSGVNRIPLLSPHGKEGWKLSGKADLQHRLRVAATPNVRRAKNVIIFVGDGMGLPTIAAARILKGQLKNHAGPEDKLAFEEFPHLALAKTYNIDRQVPDSAGTATAIFSGSKTNSRIIGYDENVKHQFCPTERKSRRVPSFLSRASRETGRGAGVVTTTRVTHATPAAVYAHSASRYWERTVGQAESWNEPSPKDLSGNCSDIASQLVDNDHGIDVFLGGGRSNFLPQTVADPAFPGKKNGSRADERHLIDEWLQRQRNRGKRGAAFVWNKKELQDLDIRSTDSLLGLFSPSHMPKVIDDKNKESPSLAEMTTAAISILGRREQGFFLMVEGGRIDHAHHDGEALHALYETLAFDQAVEAAMNMTSMDETLIVVTSDHSHGFMFTGKPSRGNPIFGFDDYQVGTDGFPYTPLLYGTGPGHKERRNITPADAADDKFKQDAAVPLRSETHGGEDVPVYATGPFAHLFTGVFEQNYLAHAIMYAACIGDAAAAGAEHCRDARSPNANSRLDSEGDRSGRNGSEDERLNLCAVFLSSLLILHLLLP